MSLLARRPDVKLKRRAIRRFDTYYKRMANYRRNWPSTIKEHCLTNLTLLTIIFWYHMGPSVSSSIIASTLRIFSPFFGCSQVSDFPCLKQPTNRKITGRKKGTRKSGRCIYLVQMGPELLWAPRATWGKVEFSCLTLWGQFNLKFKKIIKPDFGIKLQLEAG